MEKNEIKIYSIGKDRIEVKVEKDTIWLNQKQIAGLFGVNRPAITKHLSNIFRTKELEENSVCSKMEHILENRKNRKYQTKYYSLDAIISVGYRVNSKKATQFRIWATNTLRNYLVNGYAVDRKRLAEQEQKLIEIQNTIKLIRDKSDYKELKGQEKELINIISDYTKSLVLLNKFDENRLSIGKVNRYIKYEIKYQDYILVLKSVKKSLVKQEKVTGLFGVEVANKMKGIVGAINQTFGGTSLYQSIEEKAAHLLYFVIKDHPFTDGNKRIGSVLFIYYLNKNNYLCRSNGEKKINDNAMVALALLVAASDSGEKENIIKLIVNLIKD